MSRSVWVCVTLLASLCASSATQAVDYFWQNSTGGAFDEFSNWDPRVPPGPGDAGDSVNFDLGVFLEDRYLVTDVSGENDQLIVHDDYIELNVFPNYTLLSSGGVNPSFVVGAAAGDLGNVILSGDQFSVLETEVARLANVADSRGFVTARGLTWNGGNLRIGYAGEGALTIEEDATVTSTNVSIGHLGGSIGRAVVQNGGSWGITGNLFVGREGEGDLTIILTSVTCGEGSIGHLPGSDGTAIVSAGNWTSSGDLLVGRQGIGNLNITNGSSVTNVNGSIGTQVSGDGTATVGGFSGLDPNTWTNNGSLTVGNSGGGRLSITFAGVVTNVDAFVGRLAGSQGSVSVDGGQWTTTGRLSIGGDADTGVGGGDGLVEILDGGTASIENEIVIFPSGDLVLDGGSLSSAIITVQPGGQFVWSTGSLGVDTFFGNLGNPGGVLAARPNSNSIFISGEYSQAPGGVLSIDIAGSAASNEYDSVIVGNSAFLGGELEVHLADDFEPSRDEEYVVLDALNIGLSSFSNVASGQRLADANGVGSFLVHYGTGSPFDPSRVVLSDFQLAGLPGDYNDDGSVNAADYVVWRKGIGTASTPENYNLWRANYGTMLNPGLGVTGSASGPAVPEPSTFLLLLAPIAFLCFHRHQNLRPVSKLNQV